MFDVQTSMDTGGNNAACVVSLSGISRQIILDALDMLSPQYRWYPAPLSSDAAQDAIDSAIAEIMTNIDLFPIGVMMPFAGLITAIPAGWLHCNGSQINTELYPDLFAVIGYQYGGSGSMYALPETRNVFLRGSQSNNGATGGANTATLATSNIPPHTHTMTTFSTTTPSGAVSGTGRYITGTTSTNTGSAGGSGGAAQAFSIVPPYVDVLWIIRAGSLNG